MPTVIHIVSNESNPPGWGGSLWKLVFESAIKGVGEVDWLVNSAPPISFKRIPYPIHHITNPIVPFLSNNTYLWSQVFFFFSLITSRFFLGGIFHLLRNIYIYIYILKAQFFIDDLDKFFEFSRSDGYYNMNNAQFFRKKIC